jgi:DNA polymerase-1
MEKFGVTPDRVVDVQSLAGDSVDNVPGAPGIGLKTAALLINEYGDLDTLLARAGEIKQPKRREALTDNADLIRISRQLVTLTRRCRWFRSRWTTWSGPRSPTRQADGIPDRMEFRSLTRRVAERLKVAAPTIEAPRADEEPQRTRRPEALPFDRRLCGDPRPRRAGPLDRRIRERRPCRGRYRDHQP